MLNLYLQLMDRLRHQPAVLVRVVRTQGSVPRDAGAWMAVTTGDTLGTVGGGQVEWAAIAHARGLLIGTQPSSGAEAAPAAEPRRFALGPSLGQCCGGVVWLGFELLGGPLAPAHADRLREALCPRGAPVALFGGGHVGSALVAVLARLPFDVTWIDSRDSVFDPALAGLAACDHSDPVEAAVPHLAPGARVLVMSFSHAEDLDVVAACLLRQRARADLPFIGLIGSATKWATFRSRLAMRGFGADELAQVTCPIGVPGIHGKEPEVIAVAVAAQLLQTLAPAAGGAG